MAQLGCELLVNGYLLLGEEEGSSFAVSLCRLDTQAENAENRRG
jgi:hypothetical protein